MARADERLRERDACRASGSRARSPRRSAASRSSASRRTPAPSTAIATTTASSSESVAERLTGRVRERPRSTPRDVVDLLLDAATTAPELWHQKSYLARAISRDRGGRLRDEGIVSLAEFVDAQAGPDGVAITVETDDRGRHPPGRLRAAARPGRHRQRARWARRSTTTAPTSIAHSCATWSGEVLR